MNGTARPFRFRPWIQGFFFLLFLFLFARLSYPFTKHFADNFFFALDPLAASILAVTGSITLGTAIGASLLIILTLVLGRVFCGYICPMGAVLDVASPAFANAKQRTPYGNGRYRNIKFYLLAFMGAGAVAGFTALLLLDPLVFLFRVFAVVFHPFAVALVNLGLNLIRPFASGLGWYSLAMVSYEQPVFSQSALILAMFLAAVGLVGYERRFWCRNLCPLGALLGIFARFSIRKRAVSESCIGCGKCIHACPVNAIAGDFRITSARECIQCGRCAETCPAGAISFPFSVPAVSSEFNPSRRGMLVSASGGLLAGLAVLTAIPVRVRSGNLLRPPGSRMEPDFLDTCLRCGECMKACPTNGLQPAGLQAGIEGVFTPVLIPRAGGCEEQCNICGQVCPTGAIRNLPLEEKQYAVIGNAMIERSRCIAWEQGKVCLVCDEACPFDAVEFRVITDEVGTIKRPFVTEDKCVGCGQCENACPVNGPAAIRVTPINEERKNTGSYITAEKRRRREVIDDVQDFSLEKGTPGVSPADSLAPVPGSSDMPDGFIRNDLPEGFVR